MQKIKGLNSITDLDPNIQKAILSIPKRDRYVVALSGGMDSVALAYFCLPQLKKYTNDIQAVHINHGLSPNAESWASFCKDLCRQLAISCDVINVSVVCDGEGVESAARKARYAIFSEYMEEGGVLLQGHHLNDQSETVLMRLMKGLGPEALKGIPKIRDISNGILYRPWLDLPRDDLAAAADKLKLTWVEDESNQDNRFERNFIRNEVLPILQKRRPTIVYDLGRSAKKSKAVSEFILEWCDSQKHLFLSAQYHNQTAIDLKGLRAYSIRQQSFILRYWFDLLKVSHPNEANFQRIFNDLLTAANDSKAEVSWKGNVLRVYDGALFCISKAMSVNNEFDVEIGLPNSVERPTQVKNLPNGKLTIRLLDGFDQALSYPKCSEGGYEVNCSISKKITYLGVRSRKAGDKIYLHSKHSTLLKKLYQSKKILPWHRDKLPIIYSGDTIVGSLAGMISEEFSVEKSVNTACKVYCFRFEFT